MCSFFFPIHFSATKPTIWTTKYAPGEGKHEYEQYKICQVGNCNKIQSKICNTHNSELFRTSNEVSFRAMLVEGLRVHMCTLSIKILTAARQQKQGRSNCNKTQNKIEDMHTALKVQNPRQTKTITNNIASKSL